MNEEDLKHGAIPINRFHRKAKKLINEAMGKKLIGGIPFDWSKGYDVRDLIGPIVIKDQGSNFSCGGQAGSYFLEIERKSRGIKEEELSAKSVYSPIAYRDGGTTVTALMTQIAAHGANLEKEVPSYSLPGLPLTEPFMEDKSWINYQTTKDALTRAGYTPYDIAENIDDVAINVQQYGAVLWEITGQNNGTWISAYPKPPSRDNPNEKWNHFMCAIGAKMINGRKYIVALQSEGENWGDHGVQYIGEDYFKSGYVVDCFTFIYDTQVSPIPSNFSIWANITRWFRLLWSLKTA